mmetsp:Transcript_10172/g.11812  ORF Transcript_10172/g.11812 Transcript_10172/m.11812 type:complete len:535 (+) Transcript_10172:230-1834(+)
MMSASGGNMGASVGGQDFVPVMATFPACLPSSKECFFSIRHGKDDLLWSFHRTNKQSFVKWNTPYIEDGILCQDDAVKLLAHYLPDDSSDPYRYVFGVPGEDKCARCNSSSQIKIFIIDETSTSKEISPQAEKQLLLLSKLWSSTPHKFFKLTNDHFFQTTPVLSRYCSNTKIEDFNSSLIASFALIEVKFGHPFLLFHSRDSHTFDYISTWQKDNINENSITSGSLSMNEDTILKLGNIVCEWSENIRFINAKSPIHIFVSGDHRKTVQSKLYELLSGIENTDLGAENVNLDMRYPLLYGVNHLIEYHREKVVEREKIVSALALHAAAEAREKGKERNGRAEAVAERRRNDNAVVVAALKRAKKRKAEAEAAEGEKKCKTSASRVTVFGNDNTGIERNAKQDRSRNGNTLNDNKGIEINGQKIRSLTNSESTKKKDDEKYGIEKSSSSLASARKKTKTVKYIGSKMAKEFDDDTIYFGTVVKYYESGEEEPLWSIEYDDGDAEDMNEEELVQAMAFHRVVKRKKDAPVFTRKK